jgi:glycosyltransferase involved in cell wall biosynthesis
VSSTVAEFDGPLVSLVIPAYNHAGYLAAAVKSVLAQDYPKVELIVLDDGSTDETAAVLAELDDGFYWETQANIGQSRTLARGWEMAKGEILGYLSADDTLEPNAVRGAVAVLMSMPAVVATYCDFHLIDPGSRRVRTVRLPEFNYEHMLTRVSCPIGPGAFFRRSVYLQSGPWNPQYRQMPDYDFWLRIGLHGAIYHLPQVLAAFRVHEGSQTYSVTTPERAEEPVLIVSGLLNEVAAVKINSSLRECALASANLVSAQLHLRAGRFFRAWECIQQALRHSPKEVMSTRTLRMLANAITNRTAHRLLWKLRRILKISRK